MNIFDADGFGSRKADEIFNESYYSGIEEQPILDAKGLTKEEENAITLRLVELMFGKKVN